MGYEIHEGDCLEVMRGLPSASVSLIVTSPPYNCRKQYGDDDDQMPWPAYYEFMGLVLDECYRLLEDGGTLALNVPGVIRWQSEHRHADTWSGFDANYKSHRNGEKTLGKGRIEPLGFKLFDMMNERDPHMREPIVWAKGTEGNAITTDYRMGCDSDPYIRPAHEWILLGSKARWFHRGGTGRRGPDAVPWLDETKDVWFIPPVSDRKHPAPFPVELPLRLIRLFTHASDAVVLDPFCGRGSTGLACVEAGRPFIGIERQGKYAADARRRIYESLNRQPLFAEAVA